MPRLNHEDCKGLAGIRVWILEKQIILILTHGHRKVAVFVLFGRGVLFDWKLRVTLTEIAPCNEEDAKDDAVAAYLVSGENACPPEDVGGVQGYAGALQSFNDPED